MSSLGVRTAGPKSLSRLTKGPYSAHARSCCLCAGLEGDIKPMGLEMPLEVEWGQKTGPLKCSGTNTGTNDDIMDSRGT